MSKNDEYLKILGLDNNFKNLSSKEQEKALAKAWRKFSIKWHPDINKSSYSEKKFKQGNEANEKLKEAIKNGAFKSYSNEKQTHYENQTKNQKTDNSYENYNTYSYAQTPPKDNNFFQKSMATMIIIMISFCLCSMESNNKTPKYPITKAPTEQTVQSETKLETETKTETKSENEEQENQKQEEESVITSIIQEDIEEETRAEETTEEDIDESDLDVIY